MAGPYDAVITIGGQSFVDGIWRILGPALDRLTNPLPLALPGFTNANMRITNLVPVYPGNQPTPGLHIVATVELVAEALLHVVATAEGVAVALGPQALELTSLSGDIDLPGQTGSISNLLLSGGAINLGPGTGALGLDPVTGSFSGTGTGTLGLPDTLAIPGAPFPAIVPVALDLTPSFPLILPATVEFGVSPPSPTTRSSLAFLTSNVNVGAPTVVDPNLAVTLTTRLQVLVNRLVQQLGIPAALPQLPIDQTAVQALIAPVTAFARAALDEALTLLMAETGRLIFPIHGGGASCDVHALPFLADATLTATPNNGYRLQIGFVRPGSGDIANFPTFGPGAFECHLLVGNSFVLELLGCLVEQLPCFVLPNEGVTEQTPHHDVNGNPHRNCRNYRGVTATFGPFVVGGGDSDGISICIDGQDNETKRFSLIGKFGQDVPSPFPLINSLAPTIASIEVGFTLPLAFNLDSDAALTDLRVFGKPQVSVKVSQSLWFGISMVLIGALIGAAVGWLAAWFLAPFFPLIAILIILAVFLGCGAAEYLLKNAVRTVLGGASLFKSPVALPPGVFEAFGKFSPIGLTVDDLTSEGVLHTPTSPWALLPRLGLQRRDPKRPPPDIK